MNDTAKNQTLATPKVEDSVVEVGGELRKVYVRTVTSHTYWTFNDDGIRVGLGRETTQDQTEHLGPEAAATILPDHLKSAANTNTSEKSE